eukprot:747034-Hanusia_phi.AAC.4
MSFCVRRASCVLSLFARSEVEILAFSSGRDREKGLPAATCDANPPALGERVDKSRSRTLRLRCPADLIRSVMNQRGEEVGDRPQALKKSQEEEEEKARSTHGERGEGEGLKYELHSPNLLFEDGVSIGKLSGN